ncbi:MAG TPA: ABC transporter permease [Gemmatimonadaceae bacterium]|nr:ABC transporter permease [Gemmatimonadaceae bacterium]
MTWLTRILGRRRLYDDLSDEMQAHLDEKTDALIASGMPRAHAEAAARRAFGNVTRLREEGRDAWQWPTLESFLMDARYALRQLRRAPALTAVIVLTLAVGIAATTTVFSWTRAILLDPLPGAGNPGRVLALESTTASGTSVPTSWLDYRDYRRYLKSFDGLAAAYPTSLALGDAAHSERRWGELVSGNFFDVLEVHPALGRFFPAGTDDAEGAQPVAVISYDLWQARWHGAASAIGSVVQINRYPFTVIGVAPPAFHGSMAGEDFQLWIPATSLGQIVPTGGWMLRDRGTRMFRVLARVAPGVDIAAARKEVQWFGSFMARANGAENEGMGGTLLPLWQSHFGVQSTLRAPLVVLLGACGLVLLIVCANMANLLLARATGRRREFGLRLALGAPRRRLVRQLLTEASLLAMAGSALGLLATAWLARSLRWLVPSFAVPSLLDPHVDAGVLAFTAALAGAVTLVAGIAPALHGSRESLGSALNDGGRAAVGGVHATRLRGVLVGAEMALAVISLVGAGLFYTSFRATRAVSPGFDAGHVTIGSVSLTLAGYDSANADNFLRAVADRIRRQPGVSAVSYTDYVPLSVGEGSWEELRVEGYAPQTNENMKVHRAAIGPDYFKTLRIPLLAGRDFRLDDDSAHAPVMIVNDAFVQHFLRGRAPLGIKVHGWGKWFTIVGVARDVKNYRLTDPPTPYFYVPVRQVYRPEYGYTFVARSAAPAQQAASVIAQAVKAADPTVPVFNAMSLADYIAGPLRGQQAAAQMLGVLAGVALFLAAIGLYGVIAYSVAQRTKEIGVRIALGAQRSDVLRGVASQAAGLLVGGLAVGLGGAAALGRIVSAMLFAVSPGDVTVFAGAATAIVVIALTATGIPAWRAARVDPVIALRAD